MTKLKNLSLQLATALLFAACAGSMLCKGSEMAFPAGLAALIAMGWAIVWAALTWTRWQCLGTAGLVGVGALVLWKAFPDLWGKLLDFLPDFVLWALRFAVSGQDPLPEYALAWTIAVGAAVGLVAYLCAARFALALPLAAAGVWLCVNTWLPSGRAILWETTGLFVAILMVWARTHARSMARRGVEPPPRRAALSLYACVSAALAVLIPLSFLPQDADGCRVPQVEMVVDDVVDALSPYTGYQRSRRMFSIGTAGFMPLGDRLGGPVTPSEDLLLRVDAVDRVLLRGSVSNYYFGDNWGDTTGLRTYRLGSPLWKAEQAETYDYGRPANASEEELLDSVASKSDLEVEVVQRGDSTLFSTGRVVSLRPASYRRILPNFDTSGELFSKRVLRQDDAYTVTCYLLPTDSRYFADKILALEAKQEAEPEEKKTELSIYYMNLPEDLPDIVHETALLATAEAETPYQKALALQNYLRENYEYTLEAQAPPEGEEFVSFFLESGEGYCTYFASAMAVMGRTLGLPTRYIQGYTLENARRSRGAYQVTGEDAHAWVEVYIDGIGWLPFDPTPLDDTKPPVETNNTWAGGGSPYDDYHPGGDIGAVPVKAPFPWTLTVVLAVGCLVAFNVLAHLLHRWRRGSARLRRKYRTPEAILKAVWRDCVAMFILYGTPLEPGDTPDQYAGRIDRWFRTPYGRFGELAALYDRMTYGGRPPAEAELARALQFHAFLEGSLRHHLSYVAYLFRRILFPRRPVLPIQAEPPAPDLPPPPAFSPNGEGSTPEGQAGPNDDGDDGEDAPEIRL